MGCTSMHKLCNGLEYVMGTNLGQSEIRNPKSEITLGLYYTWRQKSSGLNY